MKKRHILPNSSGIYQIKCLHNGKVYIGSSVRIRNRISRHVMDLRKQVHSNRHLQNAFNKYGESNFKVVVLKLCLRDNLACIEQYYLDKFRSYDRAKGYNFYKKAYSPKGHFTSEETKKKISASLKGHFTSEETKKKIGRAHRGKKNVYRGNC